MPSNRFVPIDIYGAQPNIDAVHKRIHDGIVWTASRQAIVGTGTAVSMLITAPAGEDYHATFEISATNAVIGTFSEAPNASGGSAITSYNHKRNSTNTDNLTITYSPTYVSAGTVLKPLSIGSDGQGNSSGGGSGLIRDEWMLNKAAETSYLIRLSALNASTYITISFTYYKGS